MWNLENLYKSTNDLKIEKDKKQIKSKASLFVKKYKGKISSADSVFLLSALNELEIIKSSMSKLVGYAYLIHSTMSNNEAISSFYQSIKEFGVEIANQTIWFNLEIQKIDDRKINNIIDDSRFKKYSHYLKEILNIKPYVLDEEKELLISKKNQSGVEAFVRLYGEFSTRELYNGKTHSEISAIYAKDPNRNKRKEAGQIIADTLKNTSNVYSYILNTLLLDKKISDEIRGFKYPEQSTFIEYEVTDEIVKAMSDAIFENNAVSEKFYLAKSKLLKTKLFEWDRYNDIYKMGKNKVSWEETKVSVLNAFKKFSPTFYDIALRFFENNWIDYEVKKGKRGGAYCAYVSNTVHPYVFMNFTGEPSDAGTLAHELGHAIHGVLSKDQSEFEYRPSTATAEIASVFAEALMFDDIYKKAKNKKEKINLLGARLQNTFATVFRQNAFYLFEKELHKFRRTKGELSVDDINNLYQINLSPMFGKGLTLTDNHKLMWAKISHFYNYNFYVFTYSFGELLAQSLYAKYKKDGSGFTKKYIKALSLGGSKSPLEITKAMGLDITKKSFWQDGLNLIKEEVDEFEKLIM